MEEEKQKITRGMIVEFGKRIFNHPDVNKVRITINFNDGSDINYSSKFKDLMEVSQND